MENKLGEDRVGNRLARITPSTLSAITVNIDRMVLRGSSIGNHRVNHGACGAGSAPGVTPAPGVTLARTSSPSESA